MINHGEYSGCNECRFWHPSDIGVGLRGTCERIGTAVRADEWCKLFESANQPLRADHESE